MMTNYPNGFEHFPIQEMTLRQFLRHARTALSMMTWKPWQWAHYYRSRFCIDLISAWYLAGHALDYSVGYTKEEMEQLEQQP